MAATLDSFIELFVPFAASRPKLSPIGSTALFRSAKRKSREETEDRGFPSYSQERRSIRGKAASSSLPFSDRRNPNEPPRLPSPSHGDVACCVRKRFNFVGRWRREVDKGFGGRRKRLVDGRRSVRGVLSRDARL